MMEMAVNHRAAGLRRRKIAALERRERRLAIARGRPIQFARNGGGGRVGVRRHPANRKFSFTVPVYGQLTGCRNDSSPARCWNASGGPVRLQLDGRMRWKERIRLMECPSPKPSHARQTGRGRVNMTWPRKTFFIDPCHLPESRRGRNDPFQKRSRADSILPAIKKMCLSCVFLFLAIDDKKKTYSNFMQRSEGVAATPAVATIGHVVYVVQRVVDSLGVALHGLELLDPLFPGLFF